MNCRGTKRREQIVEEYDVIPIAQIRLINGREIHSDAEATITDKYFIFECTNKENGITEEICVGNGAARHFFQLTNTIAPTVFNMLHEENNGGQGGGNGPDNNNPRREWNPAAKQLYNAIMILIVAWDLKPGPIFELKKQAEQYYYCQPYTNRVNSVNNILHRHNTSMREILNHLSDANNNRIREYHFDLLETILQHDGITPYFEDANGR